METSYDRIPYIGSPFSQTHPDRLATLAHLFGMTPAPVEHCRVLELGCTDGGNLIPMALPLPESRFIGVDLAHSAIATGKETISALGLTNIELRAADLAEVSPKWGEFDFIIAHGVFSWVPAPVREHILRIANENLAPQGVAYISYNAYPGCHLRGMIRDMMLFHVRGILDPVERVGQARALVAALAQAAPSRTDGYQVFLRAEAENILERDPNVLFHDELSDVWQPFFFHEFLEQAAANGLQFLSEANFADMQDPSPLAMLPPENADRVSRDQYRDFLKCRKFRQTLLCHGNVELDAEPRLERLDSLYIDSAARLVSETEGVKEFSGPHNAALRTAHPLAIRILERLISVWPDALPFEEVAAPLSTDDRQAAKEIVFAAFRAGLIQLHVLRPRLVSKLSARPIASPLARLQAEKGIPLTTLRHSSIEPLSEIERKLVVLLDGTRDSAAILKELRPLRPEVDDRTFAGELEANLRKLVPMALLAG